MTAEREGLAEEVLRLAEVIVEHSDEPMWSAIVIARHQWDALADLLAARDRRVRGEALREAADNREPEFHIEVALGSSDYVRHWLRDRADRIEADA